MSADAKDTQEPWCEKRSDELIVLQLLIISFKRLASFTQAEGLRPTLFTLVYPAVLLTLTLCASSLFSVLLLAFNSPAPRWRSQLWHSSICWMLLREMELCAHWHRSVNYFSVDTKDVCLQLSAVTMLKMLPWYHYHKQLRARFSLIGTNGSKFAFWCFLAWSRPASGNSKTNSGGADISFTHWTNYFNLFSLS